jgi:hypothetical protein
LPAELVVAESLNVCLCHGMLANTSAFEFVPPVVSSLDEPAPMTNLLVRSGVPLLPLQRCQPLGIVLVCPDHMMIPPDGTAAPLARLLICVCVAVMAPVTLGNVALMVALSNRMWSSACAKPSVDAGFAGTRELMYVPVSSAIVRGS